MSWDNAAPTAQELGSGGGWDAAPPKPEELEGKSISGFAHNLGEDVRGTAAGIGHLAEGLVLEPKKTLLNTAQNLVPAIVNEGKRLGVGELLTGHPINAIEKFGNAAYEKPLTTTLDVLPAIGAAGKALGIGGEAARGAEMASEAGSLGEDAARMAPEAAGGVDLGAGAEHLMKEAPGAVAGETPQAAGMGSPAAEASVPLGSTFQETVQNLGKRIPSDVKAPLQQVGDFLTQKYGQAAEKPGFGTTLGELATRKGQGMRFKQIGFSPGQIRALIKTMGEEKTLALSDLAKKTGVTDPVIGYQVGQRIKNLEQTSGQMLGGFRELAAKRGGLHDMGDVVSEIKSKLDSKYTKGLSSGETGNYQKALEELSNTPPTPDALAETITRMNKYASENKMTQAKGAYTDVANEASRVNNRLIESKLSPKEFEAYKDSLKNFGASQIFKRGRAFAAGRELAGRGGVGDIWTSLKKGVMDAGGGKVMENFYDRIGPKLKNNPEMVHNLGTLSEETLSDILGALDDAIDEVTTK